jgi:hypothetical protein
MNRFAGVWHYTAILFSYAEIVNTGKTVWYRTKGHGLALTITSPERPKPSQQAKIPSQLIEEFVIAAMSPLTAPRNQFGSVCESFSRAVNADSVVGKGSVHFRNVYLRHVAGGAVILTRRARLTGMIFVRFG